MNYKFRARSTVEELLEPIFLENQTMKCYFQVDEEGGLLWMYTQDGVYYNAFEKKVIKGNKKVIASFESTR